MTRQLVALPAVTRRESLILLAGLCLGYWLGQKWWLYLPGLLLIVLAALFVASVALMAAYDSTQRQNRQHDGLAIFETDETDRPGPIAHQATPDGALCGR